MRGPVRFITGAEERKKHELEFPNLQLNEDAKPAIEVSIDFIPAKFRNNWHSTVYGITADWIKKTKFAKKATLWMWGTMSVNLISAHPQHPVPSWSDFIVEFGFGKDYFDNLSTTLQAVFEGQASVTEMLQVSQTEGWKAVCHVEKRTLWIEDDPDSWIPFIKNTK